MLTFISSRWSCSSSPGLLLAPCSQPLNYLYRPVSTCIVFQQSLHKDTHTVGLTAACPDKTFMCIESHLNKYRVVQGAIYCHGDNVNRGYAILSTRNLTTPTTAQRHSIRTTFANSPLQQPCWAAFDCLRTVKPLIVDPRSSCWCWCWRASFLLWSSSFSLIS